MKTVTIMVDHRAIKAMLRAFNTHVEVNPSDEDAAKVRQMIIETDSIVALENLMDALLEIESAEKHECNECPAKEECHPPKELLN